jgi:hypothetical protein
MCTAQEGAAAVATAVVFIALSGYPQKYWRSSVLQERWAFVRALPSYIPLVKREAGRLVAAGRPETALPLLRCVLAEEKRRCR